ncbi:AAA family ATPase [Marichromatium gracile]|uniref:AAA family ATPase n=1 Tax=Marichromatium gracile TaxID=1048 RepID=A0ABR5VJW8_MARGR|nr:MoxR family ATPase [Marichromatium gracile]KXX66023.1 AAA family ATPase [Marichromatium gracile]
MTQTPLPLTEAVIQLDQLEQDIGQAVSGQHQAIRELLVALVAAGHALLEGVPGVGKTLLVRALAAAVQGRYARIQFTPDLMPSDVTGHAVFDLKREAFRIRRGPIFCNLLLADEINRAPAKTQAAMLEAMQEGQVTIEGQALALEPPFLVFATQNPIEQEGTYPLPQAQLDRFLLKIAVAPPSAEAERAAVRAATSGRIGDRLDTSAVRPLLDTETLQRLQLSATRLRLDERVLDYAVALVRAARDWPGVDSGPGPRASIALVRAARAHALIEGRDFTTPDDVRCMVPAVLRHRLRLGAELEIEGVGADALLGDLVERVPAPRD